MEKRLKLREKKKATAMFDFAAETNDELDLKKGDIIVLHDSDPKEEWWEGNVDGNWGFFPRDFVEVIKPMAQTSSVNRERLQDSDFEKPIEINIDSPDIEPEMDNSKKKRRKTNLGVNKTVGKSVDLQNLELELKCELEKGETFKLKIAELLERFDKIEVGNEETLNQELQLQLTKNGSLAEKIRDLENDIQLKLNQFSSIEEQKKNLDIEYDSILTKKKEIEEKSISMKEKLIVKKEENEELKKNQNSLIDQLSQLKSSIASGGSQETIYLDMKEKFLLKQAAVEQLRAKLKQNEMENTSLQIFLDEERKKLEEETETIDMLATKEKKINRSNSREEGFI